MAGRRSAGPATTVKVSDRAESPSTRSKMRSPTWNGAARACAAAVGTLGPIVAVRSATTTVNNDAERFIRLSTPLYDARGRRLVATVVFVNGLVAGQIVGVVRIVTVGRATRDVVQYGAQ